MLKIVMRIFIINDVVMRIIIIKKNFEKKKSSLLKGYF